MQGCHTASVVLDSKVDSIPGDALQQLWDAGRERGGGQHAKQHQNGV